MIVVVTDKRKTVSGMFTTGRVSLTNTFRYLLVLLLVALAVLITLIGTSLGVEESWPFAILMFPVLYISGVSLARLVYVGELKPVTIISFALVFWYFGPLAVLCLGIPGFGISLSSGELVPAASRIITALLMATPLVLFEESLSSSYLKSLRRCPITALAMVIGVIAMLQIMLIASGRWTYGSLLLAGTRDDENGGTAFLQLANYLSVINLPLAAYIFGVRAGHKRALSSSGFIAALALVAGVAWHFIGGRRYLTVEVLVAAAFYLKARSLASGRSIRLGGLAKTATLLLCLVAVSWPTYFAVRVASQSVKNGQVMPSAAELLQSAAELDSADLSQGYSAQVVDRSAIINSVAIVSPALKRFALGEGLWYSTRIAAPPQLVDKSILPSSVEELWTDYGVKLSDYSNSLILDSYVDFGVLGFVLYCLLVAGLFAISSLLLGRFPLPYAIVQIGFLFQFLNGENTIASYLAFTRNGLLISIPFIVISFFTPRATKTA